MKTHLASFLLFTLLIVCTHPALGQSYKGTWMGELKYIDHDTINKEMLWLSLRPTGVKKNWGTNSFSLDLEDLSNLNLRANHRGESESNFQLIRDAGTLTFKGTFLDEAGSGLFAFDPSSDYVSEMRRMGYDNLSDRTLFNLALFDVSRIFIKEMESLGYSDLSIDRLQEAAIHGARPDFVRAMAAEGYTNISFDKLLAFRIHGVSPNFVRDFRAAGYENISSDRLIELRIHGVSPEYITSFQQAGYEIDHLGKFIDMRIHGVSMDYINTLGDLGYNEFVCRPIWQKCAFMASAATSSEK